MFFKKLSSHSYDFKGGTGKIWWQIRRQKQKLKKPKVSEAKDHISQVKIF